MLPLYLIPALYTAATGTSHTATLVIIPTWYQGMCQAIFTGTIEGKRHSIGTSTTTAHIDYIEGNRNYSTGTRGQPALLVKGNRHCRGQPAL